MAINLQQAAQQAGVQPIKLDQAAQQAGVQPIKLQQAAQQAGIKSVAKEETRIDPEKEKKGLLDKITSFTDVVIGAPAELLFGTTAGAVGSLAGQAVEATKELITGQPTEQRFTKEAEKRFGTVPRALGTAALTGLELTPAAKLAKAPGAKQLVSGAGKLGQALKVKAAEQFGKVLAPTTKATKKITQRIAPELAERKVVALSREDLKKQAINQLKEVGGAFDDVLARIPEGKLVNTKPVVDALEAAKNRFRVATGQKTVTLREEPIRRIEEIQNIIREFGNKVDFKTLRELRKTWDDLISESDGFLKTVSEGTKLNIEKKAANAIRNELAKESPELAKINAEFTFWKNVQRVISETVERDVGKKGLLTQAASLVGGGAGLVRGGVKGAIVSGVVANQLQKLINSTAFRTIGAKGLTELANAISSGNTTRMLNVVRRLLTTTKNILTE